MSRFNKQLDPWDEGPPGAESDYEHEDSTGFSQPKRSVNRGEYQSGRRQQISPGSDTRDLDKLPETVEDIRTVPFDPRFPNQNQTRNCYQNYLDYHRCRKARGTDYEPCAYFKFAYRTLCPNAWHQKWDEQVENGNFAGHI